MGAKPIVAFDIEADYDAECNIEALGAYNYLASTHIYSIAFFGELAGGERISWVGDPKDVDWSQFAGCELWAHNRLFDQTFFQVAGLPDPGGNCTSNLSRYLCGEYSLAKAVKLLLRVEVDKSARDEMKGRIFKDLPSEEQTRMREYNLTCATPSFATGWRSFATGGWNTNNGFHC
jgi:hypothetical protein